MILAALPMALASCAENPPIAGGTAIDAGAWEIVDVPDGDLEPVDLRFMARGYFHAKSAIRDRKALGGFWQSDNAPRRLRHDLPRGRLHLIARPEQRVAYDERFEGLQVILANTTWRTLRLDAENSRLPIVREALDGEGEWRSIEYLPRSWCGNSYHKVFLPRSHYWTFNAPRYTGSVATDMRFALTVEGKDEPIYSNEFPGSVNPEQFLIKKATNRRESWIPISIRRSSSSGMGRLVLTNLSSSFRSEPVSTSFIG